MIHVLYGLTDGGKEGNSKIVSGSACNLSVELIYPYSWYSAIFSVFIDIL